MNPRTFDCVCAGIVVADHVCAPIDHLPSAGELVTTESLDLTIGGCASNVATDLAKLSREVAIVGTVGQDVLGRHVQEALQRGGVCCDHLVQSATHQTSGTLVINVRGEDRRFIHTIGANAAFSAADVRSELLASCRVLYLGGYCLSAAPSAESVVELFRTAQQHGVVTVLDVVIPEPADYDPFLLPVLPLTDVFMPNNDEGRIITGHEDPRQQAEVFRTAGAKTVVITCGGDGAVLVSQTEKLQAEAPPVRFVDGTGSGDAFVAGFIYGLLNDATAGDCLRYGSYLGASCVRETGATTGVFTADELAAFAASHPLSLKTLA